MTLESLPITEPISLGERGVIRSAKLIVGSGQEGLTTAIHAARANLEPVWAVPGRAAS